MILTRTIIYSARGLLAHKSRALLTMLGMIIGIASVIIIMSIGASAQGLILNQIKSTGSNLIGVLPGASDENGPPATALGITVTTLTYDDAQAIARKENAPHLVAVASYVRGSATLTWQNRSVDTTFMGTTASFIDVESPEVEVGHFFSKDDERGISRVVVLGSEVAENLFSGSNAVGQTIKIKRESFKVIGVMKEQGTVFFQNQDDQVFVPLETAQKLLLGINHLGFIRAKTDSEDTIDQSLEDIRATLRVRHDISDPSEDDFSVRSIAQALDVLTGVTDAMKFFLASIAAIALVVGGIGIMNIMLVSVNERIREIGLRKAVGARRQTILFQFLVETSVIALGGGLIGTAIGAGISGVVAIVANVLGYSWDFIVTLGSVALAAGISILIGLIFGLYPAYRASRLDPIEALRYE